MAICFATVAEKIEMADEMHEALAVQPDLSMYGSTAVFDAYNDE